MTISRTTVALLAAGMVAVGGASIAAATADFTPHVANDSAPHPHVRVDGLFKPGSELTVSALCPGNETRAQLTTSFGWESVMSPAADAGYLIGFFTAPVNIEAGPDDGYHTVTVTCANDNSTTMRIEDAGNGTAKTQSEAL